MKFIRFALGSALFVALLAVVSQAQVQRTFVSGLGSDNNPCTRAAPCRTFGAAIGQTNAGGEVYVLDTAGYGAFTIAKSITINAPQGLIAGISVFSGDGIDINAGANDTVILRGLTVNNEGSTGSGIVFNTGRTLHIENSVLSGFGTGFGIFHRGKGNLLVKDTTARANSVGILIDSTGQASMEQVRLDGNSNGLEVNAGIAAIRNSSMSGNAFDGAIVGFLTMTALLDIDTCLITNNFLGVQTFSANAFMSISNCTISHNSNAGFIIAPSSGIFSRGNNTIIGNGESVGSLTPLAAQ